MLRDQSTDPTVNKPPNRIGQIMFVWFVLVRQLNRYRKIEPTTARCAIVPIPTVNAAANSTANATTQTPRFARLVVLVLIEQPVNACPCDMN